MCMNLKKGNETRGEILKNSITAAIGLMIFGFGIYMIICGNIGVGAYDALHLGIAKTFSIKYGTASVTVSLIILALDLLLKEKIGIGTILDAVIVGKTVDLLNFFQVLPKQHSLVSGIAFTVIGLVIMGFAQFLYMKTGLGCGPRDAFLVGISRRLLKVPIGAVGIGILGVATFLGWLLGGPIGVGTIIVTFLMGPIMQMDFKIVKFVPEDVEHQDLLSSMAILLGLRKGN